MRDLDLISAGRQVKLRGRVNVREGNREAGSGLSWPVISSSRYLSYIESPSFTNTNSVISPQVFHPHDLALNNEEEVPASSASNKGTPLDERTSLVGRKVGGNNDDMLDDQKTNTFMSEIYCIMQQNNNKTWRDRVLKVIDFTKNMEGYVLKD